MSKMSIIGIDFGNESCYVAVARGGGIETVDNDYSLRATPSYVAFDERNRTLGVGAKNRQIANVQNTIFGFKRLLGRTFDDPSVQEFSAKVPFAIVPGSEEPFLNDASIKVKYQGQERTFIPEQIVAMLFTKLKETTSLSLRAVVHDCVVSVPSYFTDAERRSLLHSCQIAGLNVLKLMSETTAVALNYGIYKQDLPQPDQPPRNVIFVDFGHSALQIFACAFNFGQLKVIATATDPFLGGRNFDEILANHFQAEFLQRYGINVNSNRRAYIRLITEVEKLKKQMSANSTKLQLNIECFMDDKDVNGQLSRADFEKMAEPLFKRFETTLVRCLSESGLTQADIYSVEIIGGSTRIPAVKSIIQNICNKIPATTLNQDEAVARGCALQCAILSPICKVRPFNIIDLQAYPILLGWQKESGENQFVQIFPRNHPIPFSRAVTLYRMEPVTLNVLYPEPVPFSRSEIGVYRVMDIKPAADGNLSKVKVKVRISASGIFSICSATLFEKVQIENEEPMDTTEVEKLESAEGCNIAQNENLISQESAASVIANAEPEAEVKFKYRVLQELPITSENERIMFAAYEKMFERESQMVAEDKQEMDRVDAKNALEEFIYEMRDKLNQELGQFASEEERQEFLLNAGKIEEWLYNEGELEHRQAYVQRLDELKLCVFQTQERYAESTERPKSIERVGKYIESIGDILKELNAEDPKYDHLPDDDKGKVAKAWENMGNWFSTTTEQLRSLASHLPAPVKTSEIYERLNSFKQLVEPIINKPKPTPPVEVKSSEETDLPTAEPNSKPNEDPTDIKDPSEGVNNEVPNDIEVD